MTLELLKQYIQESEALVQMIESGTEAKAAELNQRVQQSIDRLSQTTAAALEQFKQGYEEADRQAENLKLQIQQANALSPQVAQLMRLKAKPIDPVVALWKLQTEHPLDRWQERIQLIQGIILGYLRQIGMEIVVPSEFQALAQQIMQTQDSMKLIKIFNARWKEWQSLRWAVEDQTVYNEMTYFLWKQKGCPVRFRPDRIRQSLRKLPPVIRDHPHLDPEYQYEYTLVG